MGWARALGVVEGVEYVLEGIAVEASAGMEWQRSWFVEDDDGFVLMEDANVHVDSGFDDGGHPEEVAVARDDWGTGRDGLARGI